MADYLNDGFDNFDNLPNYDDIYKDKLIKSRRLTVHNYGFSRHFWGIYCPKSNKPILKYYSVTNHESSTLCTYKEKKLAKVERKTIKGEEPTYEVELNLDNTFHSLFNIKITLTPYAKLECTDIDGILHTFKWVPAGKLRKKLDLIRLSEPDVILATFTYNSHIPFKVGEIKFINEMGDSESILLLLFLTFTLYSQQVKTKHLETNSKLECISNHQALTYIH
ncbi:hypothetical protein K502DRAFT_351110 [Neoconidiobolus thromboides FSU 785]|nr:hypothetical protein K502DRAFT_351110 [Neoconidiobolus thromboides FSU 785]